MNRRPVTFSYIDFSLTAFLSSLAAFSDIRLRQNSGDHRHAVYSQLHQLRGRIGRGKEQSYCIFLNASDREQSMDRLKILNKSNDGFTLRRRI